MKTLGQGARDSASALNHAQRQAAATYNAAADHYDHPANDFWDRFGRRTVERLALQPGQRILDVCCGAGASAIPAAEVVGPTGSVLGVDLAENLLSAARAKAAASRLVDLEFRAGDMLALDLTEPHFDAVTCVFGIFFVPDMSAAVDALWRHVAPGGTLAVTTWGPRWFEPMSAVFWDAVRAVRPDLDRAYHPWDRLTDPNAVRELLAGAGAQEIHVVLESGNRPIHTPEDWWAMVLGTGYRGTIEALSPGEEEEVRRRTLDFVRSAGIASVEVNVIYATATRPAA